MPSFETGTQEGMDGHSNFSADEMLKMLPDIIPDEVKQQIADIVQNTVQSTMLGGYSKLYLGSSIVFLVGILLAFWLKLPKTS